MGDVIVTEARRVSVDLSMQEYQALEELSTDCSMEDTLKNAIRFLYWSRGVRDRGGKICVKYNNEYNDSAYF